MAPRLRRGPAVELLPLQAIATGGGGAYPRRSLETRVRNVCCQGALTMARCPYNRSIFQCSKAQFQISGNFFWPSPAGGF